MTSVSVDRSDLRGAHIGDNRYITQYITQGHLAYDPEFDFKGYTTRIRDLLRGEASRHVPLDLERLVLEVDHQLKLIDTPAERLADAIQREQRVIVIGNAGSGKTSSLRNLATLECGEEIRIFVELAKFRRGDRSDLDSLLLLVAEAVTEWGGALKQPAPEVLRRVLKEEQITLLLDGINEIDAASRHLCMRAIHDLSRFFPECRVVLSTREHKFDPPQGWAIFRLRELSEEQIRAFLDLQADAATRDAVLGMLALDDNPLLRLPLFLTFLVDLVRSSPAGSTPRLGSRTTIVARYVDHLFHREQEKEAAPLDADAIRRSLCVLALTMQRVGQSITIDDASRVLAPPEINDLAARGFLRSDGRYVRFWHHTLQEYFYARGRRLECFPVSKRPRTFRLARLLARTAEEDALSFMIVGASEAELRTMMRVAERKNLALATRWADDLSVDERGDTAIDDLFVMLQKEIRNIARYSRLSYRRRVTEKVLVLLFVMAGLISIAPDVISGSSAAPALLSAALFVVLVPVALILIHSLATYRGCDRAGMIFGEARNVRTVSLRQRFVKLGANAFVLPLGSFELKEFAGSVTSARRKRDPLEYLKEGRGLYLSIELLAFIDDERIAALLSAVAEAGHGNVYSIAALQTLARRAPSSDHDREALVEVARRAWMTRTLSWKYRREAGRLLVPFDAALRTRFWLNRVGHWCLVFVYALLVAVLEGLRVLLVAGIALATHDDNLPRLIFIGSSFAIAAAIYVDALRIGATRIAGYYADDAVGPWFHFAGSLFMGFVLPVGSATFYAVRRKRIRANAAGLDLQRVRAILEESA